MQTEKEKPPLQFDRLRGWRKRTHVRPDGASRFVVTLENDFGRKVFGHGDDLAEAEAQAVREITSKKKKEKNDGR